jgi:hypothetical protein
VVSLLEVPLSLHAASSMTALMMPALIVDVTVRRMTSPPVVPDVTLSRTRVGNRGGGPGIVTHE